MPQAQTQESIYYNTAGLIGSDLKVKRQKAKSQDTFVLECLSDIGDMTVDRMHYIEFRNKIKTILNSLTIKTFKNSVIGILIACFTTGIFKESHFGMLVRLVGSSNGLRRSCDTLRSKGFIEMCGQRKKIFGLNINVYRITQSGVEELESNKTK